MENPGELLRRARNRVRRKAVPERREAAESVQSAPQFVSRHASYSALMRSHDRVHTRHLQGKP